MHTVYGGANLFKYNSAKVLGNRALESFQTYAPDFLSFGKIFSLDGVSEIDKSTNHDIVKQGYENLSPEEKNHILQDSPMKCIKK